MSVLILPIHLFEDNQLVAKYNTTIYIYEHPVYFTMYKYHKLKLIMHRASMKAYADYLTQHYKSKVVYLEYGANIDKIFDNSMVHMFDPVDFAVMRSLKKYSHKLIIHESPQYLTTTAQLAEYANNSSPTLSQTSFYIWQRKRLNILLDSDKKPIGGKWTYDSSNRKPFPKNFSNDFTPSNLKKNTYIESAKRYIDKHFKNNVGSTDYYLPIDHKGAKQHLKQFIKQRLSCFGAYQDAVNHDIIFGCHSVLSPLINTGLITPQYIIDSILASSATSPLSSIEGIIRQIIGWREYMRYVYITKHKELTQQNHFNHSRKLGKEWYTAKTNIYPIDTIIEKIIKYGYAHHIERLMYLGNFMLLSELRPKEVHDWFMVMFLDSYHVFMETNVYGMSQYSAGKLMSTRPYFSSSNYLDKMSSYKKKDVPNWSILWDALYYNFIHNNIGEFSKNYAIASSVKHWRNKTTPQKKEILTIANKYLSKYSS